MWDFMHTQSGAGWQGVCAVRWLADARFSRVPSALVAEVQAVANLMLGATRVEKGLGQFPCGQSFNPGQDVI